MAQVEKLKSRSSSLRLKGSNRSSSREDHSSRGSISRRKPRDSSLRLKSRGPLKSILKFEVFSRGSNRGSSREAHCNRGSISKLNFEAQFRGSSRETQVRVSRCQAQRRNPVCGWIICSVNQRQWWGMEVNFIARLNTLHLRLT